MDFKIVRAVIEARSKWREKAGYAPVVVILIQMSCIYYNTATRIKPTVGMTGVRNMNAITMTITTPNEMILFGSTFYL
jgi:hypothetical protein